MREFDKPIGQGRFPVVDMRDDTEIADEPLVHNDKDESGIKNTE